MSTKAQRYRAEEERKRGAAPKARPRVEQRRPSPDSGARNLKAKAGKNAGVVTEVSLSGKPSRKSTRAGIPHGKPSASLDYASRQRSYSPQHRHQTR